MGLLSHDEEKQNIQELEKTFDTSNKNSDEYVYFDWYNGVGIKNRFPKDIYKSEFKLDMRRFNDRNYDVGYERILALINARIEQIKNNQFKLKKFERHDPFADEKHFLEKSVVKNTDDEKNIDDKENIQPNRGSNIYKENQKIIKKYNLVPTEEPELKQNYCNHRTSAKLNGKNLWNYMIFPEETDNDKKYKEFIMKGIKNNVFDLYNYFELRLLDQLKYDEKIKNNKEMLSDDVSYNLVPYDNVTLENLSIVNCLIFGKSNVRLCDLDKLLGLVRYNKEHSSWCVRIDNYDIENYPYVMDDGKSYNISIETNNIFLNSSFFNDARTKNDIAKNIVKVMNEVDPELLNHVNYNILTKYLMKNDFKEQQFWSLVDDEQYRIEETFF